jgi:hypothetical protein
MDYRLLQKAKPPIGTQNNMLESIVEKDLVDGVGEKGGLCCKLVDQGRRGFPDRTVLMPGSQVIFVETKAPNGKLQPWQKRYHVALRLLGFRVDVLWDRIGVLDFLSSL